METIYNQPTGDENEDNIGPEDAFIKVDEDSFDNREQQIIGSAKDIDQSATAEAKNQPNKHEDVVSFDRQGARNINPGDAEKVRQLVREDAEKHSGTPTGSIHGDGEENLNVSNNSSDQ